MKEGAAGNVKIACPNAGKDFAAEEISAQVLRKLTDDAAKFLNDKVRIPPFPHIASFLKHLNSISILMHLPQC